MAYALSHLSITAILANCGCLSLCMQKRTDGTFPSMYSTASTEGWLYVSSRKHVFAPPSPSSCGSCCVIRKSQSVGGKWQDQIRCQIRQIRSIPWSCIESHQEILNQRRYIKKIVAAVVVYRFELQVEGLRESFSAEVPKPLIGWINPGQGLHQESNRLHHLRHHQVHSHCHIYLLIWQKNRQKCLDGKVSLMSALYKSQR